MGKEIEKIELSEWQRGWLNEQLAQIAFLKRRKEQLLEKIYDIDRAINDACIEIQDETGFNIPLQNNL